MNITQSLNMAAIELKNFGPGYSPEDPFSSTISQGTSSLSLYDFGGLFLIIGIVTVFSLFCSTTPLGRKLAASVMHLLGKCFTFITSILVVNSTSVSGGSPQGGVEEIPTSVQSGTDAIDEHVTGSILPHNNKDEICELSQNKETSTCDTGDGYDNNREIKNSHNPADS